MSATTRLVAVGLLALGLAAPGAARAELAASGVMLCALMEAIDCDASGSCSAGLPQEVNLPGIVQLDFGKKKITILDEARRGESTEMRNVTVRDGRIVLQGFEARAFSLQIAQKTGALTIAVADEGYGFLVFGSCTRP
jgi:hypothetical protein